MLTTTEAAILGQLRKGRMSGYDLRKDVERSVGYFWAPAKTQIYATLPKLVASGYAKATKVAQQTRPDKVVYEATDAGLEALREWIAEAPLEAGHGRNVILLKLFIADIDDIEALLPQLAARRDETEWLVRELRELEEAGRRDDKPFERLTRRFGLLYAEAVLRWSDEAERVLRSAARARAGQERGS
jgi:PadR family transcriptional regulator, regulatory protein AphA